MPRLTLNDLEHPDRIPQRRIQEENVFYGDAYCANETKQKSVDKLRKNLLKAAAASPQASPQPQQCTIEIDSLVSMTPTFPPGKTRADLIRVILEFFDPPT